MAQTCKNCTGPMELIPRNGEPGKQYDSKKGTKYFSFYKCINCQKTLSTDPNPRKGRYSTPNPKDASNDRFDAIMSVLGEVKGELGELHAILLDIRNR